MNWLSNDQTSELRRLCEAWLRDRETVPNCELVNEERMAYLAKALLHDHDNLVTDARRLTAEIEKLNPACTSIGPGMLQTMDDKLSEETQ